MINKMRKASYLSTKTFIIIIIYHISRRGILPTNKWLLCIYLGTSEKLPDIWHVKMSEHEESRFSRLLHPCPGLPGLETLGMVSDSGWLRKGQGRYRVEHSWSFFQYTCWSDKHTHTHANSNISYSIIHKHTLTDPSNFQAKKNWGPLTYGGR